MKAMPIPSHCLRPAAARKNNTPTASVHSGVVAFNTEAMPLVSRVSLKPMNAQGIAVFTSAMTAIGGQGMLRKPNGLRRISITAEIVASPKADRRKAIAHGAVVRQKF
ncbi:hypothetical protein HMSSN036_89160 [Paenibacillus macerans]|nr:hypothetical protein HMSSN036_89160 [Paenibacillus macerans]